jgi:glutathionyl-hydroquinone reductase
VFPIDAVRVSGASETPTAIPPGAFERAPSAFRETVEINQPGRYHLYVASACPWCHRTMVVRALKGLEGVVGISYLDPIRDERGWAFTGGNYVDEIEGMRFLSEAYIRTDPEYAGHVSAPVLWDRVTGRIVNNESSEIIRMFNSSPLASGLDFYPESLRLAIEEINERIYVTVNNGVYRAGFARSQAAYEHAVVELFATLDWLERLLSKRRYLLGDTLTEADWRLFPTLVRFDPVYHGHFKCNLRRLIDYPSLWRYTCELYQIVGVSDTVALDQIKRHYYMTHPSLNPTRIVPLGPQIDFERPPRRARSGRAA